jgi:hypothetical protein
MRQRPRERILQRVFRALEVARRADQWSEEPAVLGAVR